jgi:hypothetical protein
VCGLWYLIGWVDTRQGTSFGAQRLRSSLYLSGMEEFVLKSRVACSSARLIEPEGRGELEHWVRG